MLIMVALSIIAGGGALRQDEEIACAAGRGQDGLSAGAAEDAHLGDGGEDGEHVKGDGVAGRVEVGGDGLGLGVSRRSLGRHVDCLSALRLTLLVVYGREYEGVEVSRNLLTMVVLPSFS